MRNFFAPFLLAMLLLAGSCYKSNENPFQIYLVSAQRNFPPELHIIHNRNYVGDIKKVRTENIAEITRMKPSLLTTEQIVDFKIVDNSSTVLSEIRLSLLPDGSCKKVSSSGILYYDMLPAQPHKVVIFFKKMN
ncbi:MAG: hypothetical protein RMJ53_06470 [Chitinophagales bacterium]|nr:hypothetical protein [Chitinophagales bacterium]MDW8273854.1 hypothetical protein [Chitinophagales bacterium]